MSHRPILPRPLKDDGPPSGDRYGKLKPDGTRRRQLVKVACNLCRGRKVKCDGKKPTCSYCQYRAHECVYDAGPQNKGIGAIAARLREAEQEIQNLRQYISNLDVDDDGPQGQGKGKMGGIEVKEGSLGQRKDEIERSVLDDPDGQSLSDDLVFSEMPTQYNPQYWTDDVGLPDRSIIMEATIPAQFDPITSARQSTILPYFDDRNGSWPPLRKQTVTNLELTNSITPDDIYSPRLSPSLGFDFLASDSTSIFPTLQTPSEAIFGPSTLNLLCDARLHRLDASIWTRIPIRNDFAAKVISSYLQTDAPFNGLFNPDLFAEDLIHPRMRFCSPLLFNTVMFVGCQAYTSIDRTADTVSQAFYCESVRLWDTSTKSSSLLNVMSMAMLNIGCVYQSKDEEATIYYQTTLQMGYNLGLFGPSTILLEQGDIKDPDMLVGTAHCAWGIFNWLSLHSLHYRSQGAKGPPALPAPGGSFDESPIYTEWRERTPSYMGDTFAMMCRFWVIFQDATLFYYSENSGPIHHRIPQAFAQNIYNRLLSWHSKLKDSCKLRKDAPHHVLLLHMIYHSAVMDFVRPYVRSNPNSKSSDRLSNSGSPLTIYTSSVLQLRSLTYLFAKQSTYSRSTILWHTGLLYLANAILEGYKNESWRDELWLCLRGYSRLFESFRVAEVVLRGLLALSIKSGLISLQEATAFLQKILQQNQHHKVSDHISSTWVIDLSGTSGSAPQSAWVESLAKDFDSIIQSTPPQST